MNNRPHAGPYMLIDSDWIAKARELKKKDPCFRAIARELKRRCDEMSDRRSPRFFDVDDLDSFWWRTRIGTKQLIVATWDLAMAGVYFGAEQYRAFAAKILLNLAANNMAEKGSGTCYGSPFKGWAQGALDTGHAAEGLGMSFDLLSPHFSADQAHAVGTYLLKFIQAADKFIDFKAGAHELNFQNVPMICRLGTGVLALALEKGGLLEGRKYADAARFSALEYLERGGHEEGILPEGSMYGFACLKHIAVLGSVLKHRGDGAIWASSAWDRILEAYASQIIPGEGMPNPWNDCYPPRITSWLLDAARHRRSGLARWLWETMVRPLGDARWDAPGPWDSMRAPWWNALLPHAIASYDPSVRPRSPAECGVRKRRHFVNRGIYDDRTGWGKDDWYLTVACLPDIRWRNRQSRLHAQADRGHFSLYALGEQFAVDNGYGIEFPSGSTQVIRFGCTGEAHNVPEIGGEMQTISPYAQGFREIIQDGWARLARMEFAECYTNCVRASRTIVIAPDKKGFPLYIAVCDCVVPRIASPTAFSLLLHTHEKNKVRVIDRETADLAGGLTGNRCGVFMMGTNPGRLAVESFLGHPRLRYQNQGSALYALTLLAPYLKGEKAPVFERSPADGAGNGFAVRLRFREASDTLILCSKEQVAALGYESDAGLAIVREQPDERVLVLEGTSLTKGGQPIFSAEKRMIFCGRPQSRGIIRRTAPKAPGSRMSRQGKARR